MADKEGALGAISKAADEAGEVARREFIARATAALPREAYWLDIDDGVKIRYPKLKWSKPMLAEADKVEVAARSAYWASGRHTG